MTTFYRKSSAKYTNFEVSNLGLEFQVLSLGIFDEVSISEITISTTSLLIGTNFRIKLVRKSAVCEMEL